eukprot:39965-Pyramimonas_sp.AAC.1
MPAFRLRPVLQLISRCTFPAPQLRLTVQADQVGLLLPLRVVQHVRTPGCPTAPSNLRTGAR